MQPLISDNGPDLLISTLPPGRRQIRLAIYVMLGLVISVVVTAPYAQVPLANTEPLLPAYAAAVLINDLITATLLFALYVIDRSRAVLVLSIGYLFTGLTVVPWALTFPGVLAPLGLFDSGLQSTAWIAAMRRVGFPVFVLAYALIKPLGAGSRELDDSARRTIVTSVVATVVVVCGLTGLVIVEEAILPRFMADATTATPLWRYVPAGAMLICLAALGVLLVRPKSTLDLWLTIVLCTWIIEVLLLAFLSTSRFSVGWWAGRLYGLASASLVLIVLLSEMTMLYARLSRAVTAERRTREDRLATMEALSASIAHEVNQPLSSMVTNAEAGLRFLTRDLPDVGEAAEALRSIADDGHRAGKTIESIRTMFRKDAQERRPVDVNGLVRSGLRQTYNDVLLAGITVQADLQDDLPRVNANPLQLQQVIQNLVTNAIESMSATADRPRILHLETALDESGNVVVSVRDTGAGLDPDIRERVFEPFFTTKSRGMGMGLMICRSIVEAHGGRLRMTGNGEEGATFQFALPADSAGEQGVPT